jgi:hypothetical protein
MLIFAGKELERSCLAPDVLVQTSNLVGARMQFDDRSPREEVAPQELCCIHNVLWKCGEEPVSRDYLPSAKSF